MHRYDGRVVLITGSGQGLGFDMARAFADDGARLVMVEINPDTLAEKAERLRRQGTEVVAVQGDVSQRATARDAVKQAMEKAGLVPGYAEVTFRADNDIAVSGETAQQVSKMLGMLEDLDDVQNVYSNADLGDAG